MNHAICAVQYHSIVQYGITNLILLHRLQAALLPDTHHLSVEEGSGLGDSASKDDYIGIIQIEIIGKCHAQIISFLLIEIQGIGIRPFSFSSW